MKYLTGRTRFRTGANGALILQIQTCKSILDASGNSVVLPGTWRDAKTEDLADLHALNYSQINILLPPAPEPDGVGMVPGDMPLPPKKKQH